MRKNRCSVVVAVLCALTMTLALVVIGGCGEKAPEISQVNPSSGEPGTEVTITGANFGDSQGNNSKVEFGSVNAPPESWSSSQIKVKVPSGLEAGDYEVSVVTDAGSSGKVSFTIGEKKTADGEASDRKDAQVEHNTPIEAIQAFCKKNNIDTTGWTYSVVKLSSSDPNWKIDAGQKAGTDETPMQFLLHNEKDEWTVVANSEVGWTAEALANYKAPEDLADAQAAPQNQVSAIVSYLQSKGEATTGWTFVLEKTSKQDPNWDLIAGESSSGEAQFVLVWNNMAGAYEVVWSNVDPDAGPMENAEFKGEKIPSDLTG